MKLSIWVLLLFTIILSSWTVFSLEFEEDNEFAEFEIADEVQLDQKNLNPPKSAENLKDNTAEKSEENLSNNKEDDFVHLSEDDEFDVEEPKIDENDAENPEEKKSLEIKPLQFADIPSHFRTNWSSYQVEALALFVIAVYMLNYLQGRQRNQSIANQWYQDVHSILTEQFALVGDDGVSSNPGDTLIKETDYSYTLWCSGRVGVQGLLSQLRLVKRQDIIGVVYNWYKPRPDRVTYKFELDKGELDPIVIVMGNKKNVTKATKEFADLATFAIERKGLDRFNLPSSFGLWAEIPETISAVLDPTVVSMLVKYEKYIDLIHISDQFCGPKLQEGETYTRLPDTTSNMFFTYNLFPSDSEEVTKDLLTLSLFLLEKIRRYRLSREGKVKADKKRQSVEESYLKITHQQRQEIAQARREEKARERKQRLLEEEDPEKQRRLQKLEDKRELKAKQPKMKQVRMK